MLSFPKWKVALVFLVSLLSIIISVPNFLPEDSKLSSLIPASKVNLGLDLRGGSYLLLEIDYDDYFREQVGNLGDDVRIALRKNKIGYLNLAQQKNGVSFGIRDNADAEKITKIIRDISRDLSIDEKDGVFTITFSEVFEKEMKAKLVEQSLEIVRRRVDETGTKEPMIQAQGNMRILLQVPGLQDPESLKNLLGKTAKLSFHMMDETNPFPESAYATSPDIQVLRGEGENANRFFAIQKRVIVSGDMLTHAAASFEMGMPVVTFRFNNQGGKKFGEVTTQNVGKPFAIVLDNTVISAPAIREPILGGTGQISGNFTVQSASDLALLLRAGALPAPLKVIEERTVGPSLGQDSIEAGTFAGIVGVTLVIAFMFIGYGLFGIFANIALVINIFMILACLSLFQATLTLPGIAGIVLTIGMAVDANVLIYERIREEIRLGKTPYAAIDQGFSQAFRTIFDSNITTIIAAIVLYLIGTGPVKGFAVTLTIGIACSMFSAILVTRLMVVTWLKKFKPKTIPI